MIFYGRLTCMLSLLIIGCDKNVTISTQSPKFMVKAEVSELMPHDPIPNEVKELLKRESLNQKKLVKFPLAYYLIQEEDTKVFFTSDFDQKITSQLYLTISGTKYYKLFVHPDLQESYVFLRRAYRYIGPDQTEFMATPTSGDRTIAVWTKKNLNKIPFMVKTEIDERMMSNGRERNPAALTQSALPAVIQMVFHRPIKGTKERIEGQQITKIPSLK